jgi:hypothetical protein
MTMLYLGPIPLEWAENISYSYLLFICLNKLDEYICQRILGRVMSSTRVLRSTLLQWYHPPTLAYVIDKMSMEEKKRKEGN